MAGPFGRGMRGLRRCVHGGTGIGHDIGDGEKSNTNGHDGFDVHGLELVWCR